MTSIARPATMNNIMTALFPGKDPRMLARFDAIAMTPHAAVLTPAARAPRQAWDDAATTQDLAQAAGARPDGGPRDRPRHGGFPPTPNHVLAIDDDPATREVIAELLIDAGYRVSTQASTEHALPRIAALAPDLLILAYLGVADGAGRAVLQQLRADPAFARLPVILCTAAARQMRALADQLAPMNVRMVPTPFDIDDLLGEVNDLIGPPPSRGARGASTTAADS